MCVEAAVSEGGTDAACLSEQGADNRSRSKVILDHGSEV